MKKVFLFLFFVQIMGAVVAQNLGLEEKKPTHKSFYTHTQVDLNYVNYPINNLTTNGLGLNVALVFRDRWATGLSLDVTDSKSFGNVLSLPPDAGVFEYTQVSWMNEIILHPNSRIDFSFPIKIGLGHASFVGQDGFFFGRTLFSRQGIISDNKFLVVEPGINVMVHLIRDLDLNIGGSYRLVKETGMIANGLDFTNYSVHIGLRFRVAAK